MTIPNRTKIVATLGPASRDEKTVRSLIRASVDVFRLNCAHADHPTLRRDVRIIRRVAKAEHATVAVLVDLQGPKIRVGPLAQAAPIWLQRGQPLVVSTAPGVVGEGGERPRIGTSYASLSSDVRPGETMLLDDGYLELKVVKVVGTEIHTKVVHGGLLKQHKGINVPGSAVSAESLTKKDRADLKVAVEVGADFVAQSFVRTADNVRELKKCLQKAGSSALVVAKIERPESVKNLADIAREADALMIARGDMGVELGPEAVPALQKRIIRHAQDLKKPVITATQMLESMVTNPRPTRAEASDVANAIYDGTSAVMLSAETASGQYPVRAVRIMDQIIRRSEVDIFGHWEYRAGGGAGTARPR